MNKIAYVICCNDSVEFVVIGSEEEAEKKLLVLKEEDRQKVCNRDIKEDYNRCYYWHIHEVNADIF